MTTKKAFLADLESLASALRQRVEASVSGFDPSPEAREKRKARAAKDLGFFAREYFPHYIQRGGAPCAYSPPAPPRRSGAEQVRPPRPSDEDASAPGGDGHGGSVLHAYLFERLPKLLNEKGRKLALAAPRGEAKSTICSQIFVIWCVVHGRVHYVPIIQDAYDQAAQMLEAVKVELEANPRLLMDFPKACGQGRVWNAGIAITANDIKLQALGSGKRLRGLRHGPYRPDLVILDDIENDQNVATPEQRVKLETWLNKAVLKLGPPDGSLTVLYIGTILHYDSVLARTLKKPTWESRTFKAVIEWPHRMDLWDKWGEILHNGQLTMDNGQCKKDAAKGRAAIVNCQLSIVNLSPEAAALEFYQKHKKEMDAGAIVSWPDKRPLYSLMLERYTDRNAFDSEFQNDPISSTDATFSDVTMWIQEDPSWVFFGAVDPSLGKTGKRSDPSAILVGGFNRATGVLDVIEAKIAKRLPDKIIEDIIELQTRYRCMAWAVEAVQYQEFLRSELVKRGAARGVPIPAMPIVPNKNKAMRIESLQPHVLNGLIRLHPSQTVLLQQLRHWPKGDHDDGPDCLEMLWGLAQRSGCLDTPKTSGRTREMSNLRGYL